MKNHKEIVRHISLGGENGNTQVHSSSVDSADIFELQIFVRGICFKTVCDQKIWRFKKKRKTEPWPRTIETTFSILFRTF